MKTKIPSKSICVTALNIPKIFVSFKIIKRINPNTCIYLQNVKLPNINTWVTTKRKRLQIDKLESIFSFPSAFILMSLVKIYRL